MGQSGVNLGQIEGRSWSNILQIWVEYSRGKILVQSAQNVVEHSADLGGIFRRKILGKTRSGSRVEWAKIFPQIWAKILCGFCADFVPQIWAKICLRFGRRFGADLARIWRGFCASDLGLRSGRQISRILLASRSTDQPDLQIISAAKDQAKDHPADRGADRTRQICACLEIMKRPRTVF